MDRLLGKLTLCVRASTGAPLRAAWLLVLWAQTFLLASGCATPALEGTRESDEAVARAVLRAIEASDQEALMALSVSRDEFEAIVWPTLPASRPEVGMPMEYVWQDTFTRSRTYLAQTLHEYGGERFELRGVRFAGETTSHGTYSVSRKAHLVVRDALGVERVVRFFGSIIRQNGRSKVYSYIVD